MPSYTRMKAIYLRGLLWLYLLSFGCVVLSIEPGFLDFDNLPDTNFSCVGKVIGGYYADLETNCQMFHVCTIGQLDEPMDIRFLCLNGTVFDQETRVCERIDEVDCSKSEKFYSLNLELYGNTQPSIAEENAETDPPIIIKASTTTTTTTTPKPTTRTTKTPYYTTAVPTATATKVIAAHHFPISNNPDIRFNPEEINISLNPGAAPNVRSKTVTYQQQVFNSDDNKKVVVTTHTSFGNPDKEDFVKILPNTQRPQLSATQKVKVQTPATPADINYGFTYRQTQLNSQEYTEPPHNYHYQHSLPFRHGQFRNQFKTSTYRTEHLPTTRKNLYYPNKESTTYRTYISSVKAPTYHTYRTEKPQRLQLPIPILPTLPPLSFSSPAPFSLGHHIETKRYSDHQAPPRIIISASASVSDNSGRRLNYSLGTIGVSSLLEEPPKTYDEYKEHDVVLDPFYHDVPKIKTKRRKRQTKQADENSEQAAVDVLKFLFDWYSRHQKTSTVTIPIDAEDITEINQELAPIVETPIESSKEVDFKNSALFNKSRFNIVGDILSVTEQPILTSAIPTPVAVGKLETDDYVDDNYEAVVNQNNTQIEEEKVTEKITETTTTPTTTTTSRILAIMRSRAKVHQKRIRNENRRRYIASVNALKPRVRSRGKEEQVEEESEKLQTVLTTTTEHQENAKIANSKETLQTVKSESSTSKPDEELKPSLNKSEETVTEASYLQDQLNEESNISDSIETTMSSNSAESEFSTTFDDLLTTIRENESEDLNSVENFAETAAEKIKSQNEEEIRDESLNKEKEPDGENELQTTELLLNELSTNENTESNYHENETTKVSFENVATPKTEEEEVTTFEPITEEMNKEDIYTEENLSGKTELLQENENASLEEKPRDVTEGTQLKEDLVNTTHDPQVGEEQTEVGRENLDKKNEADEDERHGDKEEIKKQREPKEEKLEILKDLQVTEEEHITENLANKTAKNEESTQTIEAKTEKTTLSVSSTPETYEQTTVNELYQTVATETTSTDSDISVTNLTPVEVTTTEIPVSKSRGRYNRRRPQRPRTSGNRRPNSRHRFSSTETTSRPTRRKVKVDDAIILTTELTPTESLNQEEVKSTSPQSLTSIPNETSDDTSATDAPLYKSANPTQPETIKESLHTTPLSMIYFSNSRTGRRPFIFNCFGKVLNKFYSDPRDCRLFHYCTSGYHKNQLLDMKFVCDLGTYFDDEKLICTKVKPERCL